MREIVGYVYDAAIYHPDCLPEEIDPNDEEVEAIFTWQDDACTSTCDMCLQPLLECECSED